MIINSLNSDKIKIIIDENDLKNSNISKKEWIGNPKKTRDFLNKLLSVDTNKKDDLTYFENFNIFTYDFKLYCIEIDF